MPVEATLGHAERLRQGLDPDGVRAAGRKGPQAFLDPPATGRPGDGGHGLSLSVRELTAPPAVLHSMYTVPYIWRFPHAAPEHRAHLPALAHPRAHGRLRARGRVGAAAAGRPGRLPPAGAAVGFARRPVPRPRLPGPPHTVVDLPAT